MPTSTDQRGRDGAGVAAAVLAGCGARLLVPRLEPHDIVDSVLDVVRAHDARRRLIAVPDGVAVMALALYEELHDRLRPRRPGGPALIELPHAEELAVMVARARLGGHDTAATDGPEDRGHVEAIAPSDDDARVAACLFDRVAPGGA